MVFSSVLTSVVVADDLAGVITSVEGTKLGLEIQGDLLPAVGDKCNIYVDVPGVGEASVGTATISQSDDSMVIATINQASGKVLVGQDVSIDSTNPVNRSGKNVPVLIGRSATDAKKAVAAAGLTAKFKVGLPAPVGVQPHTVYEQNPVAGGTMAKGGEMVITIYSDAAMQNRDSAKLPGSVVSTATAESEATTKATPSKPVVEFRNLSGPDAKTVMVVKAAISMLAQHHLSGRPLDDEISRRAFSHMVDGFDPRRLYLFRSDIDEFKRYEYELDSLYRDGDIEFFYTFFRRLTQRVAERAERLPALLNQTHDFDVDESIDTDFLSSPFASSEADLQERWRKYLKYWLLQEIAGGSDIDEARHKIQVRLTSRLNQLVQRSDEDLLEDALSILLSSYDPQSKYISPSSWRDFVIQNEQQLTGIGASLKIVDSDVQVAAIVYGSPSYKHGKLKVGDRIIAVAEGDSGELLDIREKKLADVVQLIRGTPNTVVRLKVIPRGGFETKTYSITRELFDLQTAQSTVLSGELLPDGRDGKVGYIYLGYFYRDVGIKDEKQQLRTSATRDIHKILSDFQSRQVDMIVLDLRTNSGGSLVECIDTTGLFVGQGNVVQVKGRDGQVQQYAGRGSALVPDKPVVILTSARTSSGAEILAGALQDYRRAIIVGDPGTHGSGVVYSLWDLAKETQRDSQNGEMGVTKLASQRFYRPSGDSTQMRGVAADVTAPSMTWSTEQRESSIPYAVEFDKILPASFSPLDFGINEKLLESIQEKSNARQTASPYFQKLTEEIAAYETRKARKTIPLNREAFIAEQRSDRPDEIEVATLPGIPDVRNDGQLQELLNISLDYLARYEFAQAEKAYGTREYSTGIAHYKKAVLANPDYTLAHYKLGWSYGTGPIRDGKQAVVHARRALELDSKKSWGYRLALAVALAQDGDFNAASKELEAAISDAPADQRQRYEYLRQRFQNRQPYPSSASK
ncbi:carboxy terminal-processing peptidase [Stieleria varia]|nr:carboxy terminal-processing peptidase [Stieleria varia]